MVKKISNSVESNNAVIHTSLDGCNDKFLAAIDLRRLIAQGIQDIAIGLNNLDKKDAIPAALEMAILDRSSHYYMDSIRLIALCSKCNVSAKRTTSFRARAGMS